MKQFKILAILIAVILLFPTVFSAVNESNEESSLKVDLDKERNYPILDSTLNIRNSRNDIHVEVARTSM